MDINNNQQQNTFEGGMNMTTSNAYIPNNQYRLAINLRLASDKYSNTNELHMIEGSTLVGKLTNVSKILGVTSIRDYGIIVAETNSNNEDNNTWNIFYFINKQIPYSKVAEKYEIKDIHTVFKKDIVGTLRGVIDIVTRYENNESIKLYISSNDRYMMLINILNDYAIDTTIDDLFIYPKAILNKPIFCGLTNGNLKSGLYQYSYRLYDKRGVSTEFSIPTKLIPIASITNNRSQGYQEGDNTGKGVKVKFNIDDSKLDRIQIVRIHYVENGKEPTIEIIKESRIHNNTITIIDSGQSALQTLALEEFNQASGVHILPKVIESKYDYLFAANIQTDTTQLEFSALVKDFDARSYSMDKSDHVTLLTADGNPDIQFGVNTSSDHGITDTTVKIDADCYNPDGKYGYDGNDLVYGGVGRNIDWKFIITDLDGDTTSAATSNSDIVSKYAYGINKQNNDNYATCYTALNGQKFGDAYKFDTFYNQKIGTLHPGIRTDSTNNNIKSNSIQVASIKRDGTYKRQNIDVSDYFQSDLKQYNYVNPSISYFFKSLRRGETYRFGIILYDIYQHAYPVKWITDVRVPELTEPGFRTFASHALSSENKDIDLVVRPLGIQFDVRIPEELKAFISGYEIVRCNRNIDNIKTISQGVLSRPIQKHQRTMDNKNSIDTNYPYYPSGLVTTGRYWEGKYFWYFLQINNDQSAGEVDDGVEASNLKNFNLFQFISAEALYQPDSTKQLFDQYKNVLDIQSCTYLFGQATYQGIKKERPYVSTTGSVATRQSALDAMLSFTQQVAYLGPYNSYVYLGGLYPCGTSNDNDAPNRAGIEGIDMRPDLGLDVITNPLGMAGVSYNAAYPFEAFIRKLPAGEEHIAFYANGYFDYATNHLKSNNLQDGYIDEARRNCTSYIKLYEQTNEVTFRPTILGAPSTYGGAKLPSNNMDIYNWDPCLGMTYGYIPKDKNGNYNPSQTITQVDSPLIYQGKSFISTAREVNNANITVKIIDATIAGEYDYTDLLLKKDNDKDPLFNSAKLTNIHGIQFNNASSLYYGSSMGKEIQEISNLAASDNDDNSLWRGRQQRIMMGTGGRSILLYVDYTTPDLRGDGVADLIGNNYVEGTSEQLAFYNTSAATKVLRPTGSNRIQEFSYESPNISDQDIARYILDTDLTHDLNIYKPQSSSESQNIVKAMYGTYDIQKTVNGLSYTYKPIYRSSIAGTWLVNIEKPYTVYNGLSYYERQLDTYYSYGDYKKASERKINVFSGDCYIQPIEYVSMHKYSTVDRSVKHPLTRTIVYSIPVETNINVAYSYGYEFSKNMSKGNEAVASIQLNPTVDTLIGLNQADKLYQYNAVYSSQSTVLPFSAETEDSYSQSNNIDYRCYYSQPAENNSQIDSWTKFQTSNYLDVDSRKGSINRMKTFKNELLFWQDYGFGKFDVNEQSLLQDADNQNLILGVGGVLSRYAYISDLYGMKKDQKTNTNSDSYLYWYDANSCNILRYTQGSLPVSISKELNVQPYLINSIDNQFEYPTSMYDDEYKEVIFNIQNKDSVTRSLVYNESIQRFTSLYNISRKDKDTYDINFSGVKYLIQSPQIRLYNHTDDDRAKMIGNNNVDSVSIYPYLEYIVNNNPQYVKTFDIQTFGANLVDDNYNNKNDITIHFTTSNGLKSNYQQSSYVTGDDITAREYDYRLNIARDNRNNNDNRLPYGNRMRGKTLDVQMQSTNSSIYFSLQYVITKYRISCS